MFRNYLVTALRNLAKNRLISFINIGGLTVGFACSIFIALFVLDEVSYDRWIPGTENLYRVEVTFNNPGQPPERTSMAPFPIPQAMVQKIPEVRAMARLMPESMTAIVENRQFSETVDVVDPNFLQLIKLPLLRGTPDHAFDQPESAVLSQSVSRKYFGSRNPMGRTVTFSGRKCDAEGKNCATKEHALVVTGVMHDLPRNTQLTANILIPNTSATFQMSQIERANWTWTVGWGYVALAPHAEPSIVVAKLKTIIDQSVDLKKIAKLDMRGSALLTPQLTLFRDDHLSTDKYGSMTTPGSWTMVYGFTAIGALILLIACFNFTNLATARATLRAREISLRKIVGATRGQLVFQFLTEAILVALVSLVLAFALVETLLPRFNSLLGKAIELHYLADWPLILASVGIAVFVGFLSGIYPALILSGFRPAATLRASSPTLSGSALFRTSLVVLQFAVSIGLGTAALVVFAQISFARNIDLGFHRDGVVIVDGENLSASARKFFADALHANPKIADVALSNSVPFDDNTIDLDVHAPGSPLTQAFRVVSISPSFMHLYGVHTLAGRALSETRQQDARQGAKPYNIVINASAARRLGYSITGAIGKTISLHTSPVTIVGVVEDMKMAGPKQQVADTIYRYQPDLLSIVSIRASESELSSTLAFIDKTWRQFAPTSAIKRRFLNDDFQRQFQNDDEQGRIFGFFVGIAIFIACLGLFGLSSFATVRRTKEIGIRKVFGARIQDVVILLLLQFSIPVLIANVIAWPFAWYYLHDWLEGYAYRIPLSPAYFLEAGIVALVIAWATVFIHAQRVANANPIHALRYE